MRNFPMRNFLMPHSTQIDRVAGGPFFMVTASMSRDAVLAWHLTQQISTASDVVVISGVPEVGSGGNCNPSLRLLT